jgi:hypothetical protein
MYEGGRAAKGGSGGLLGRGDGGGRLLAEGELADGVEQAVELLVKVVESALELNEPALALPARPAIGQRLAKEQQVDSVRLGGGREAACGRR